MGELEDQSIPPVVVEDVEADAERVVYEFRRAGLSCEFRRVETEAALVACLVDFLSCSHPV